MLPGLRREPDLPEILEDPDQPLPLVAGSYADIRRINRYLGGFDSLHRDLPCLAASVAETRSSQTSAGQGRRPTLTLLDVATGTGDLPEEALRLLRKRGWEARAVGLDNHRGALGLARRWSGSTQRLAWVAGNALQLPFADDSVDICHCSLTAHHLGNEGTLRLLREMDRVSRHGWILSDLRRHWVAWAAIRVLTLLFTRNRITRWDAPVSVRRSFSLEEMRHLVRVAGFPEARGEKRRGFRMSVLCSRAAPG